MILIKEIEDIVKKHWANLPNTIETIYRGGMNYVYAINLPEQKIMLKVYPPSRAYIARFEYNMLLTAFQNDVKVPKVINFGIHKNLGFLIYDPIPGENLQFEQLTLTQQSSFSTDLIDNLAKFSELSATHYGMVTEQDTPHLTWDAFLRETTDVGLQNLQAAQVLSSKQFSSIASYLKNFQRNDRYSGMAWGDLKSENIIVNKGEFAAIIDLESCFYGDPIISLGYLFAREGTSPFYLAIAQSFKTFAPFKIEDIYYYALIRLLRISQHLKTPMPTGKERDPIAIYFKGINKIINDIL